MVIDILILLVVFTFAMRSYATGLRGELLGVTGWFMTFLLAFVLNDRFAEALESIIRKNAFSTISNYFSFLFLVVFLRLVITMTALAATENGKPKGGLLFNTVAVIAGMFRGLFFLSVFFLAVYLSPMQPKMNAMAQGSRLYPYAKEFSRKVVKGVVRYVPSLDEAMKQLTNSRDAVRKVDLTP